MRVFGVVIGVVVSVGILWGLIWFNRYSPEAKQAVRDAKRAELEAKRARQKAEDENQRFPDIVDDESAHQPEPPPPISKKGPYPKAVTDERTLDFGTMARDEERKHKFTIRNEGPVPLLLSKGATNCKCTISNLPERELAPGKTVEIEVSWTPRDLDQNFRKEARIQTNDPENTEIRFVVTGKVVLEFNVSPSQDWVFGTVADDTPAEILTTITSALVDKFEIRGIESSHDKLTSEATPLDPEKLKQMNAKSGYEFRTKLAPGIPVGPFQQKLKINTDLPGDKVISINVKAFRAGPLRFLPAKAGVWNSEQMIINLLRFPASEGKTTILPVFVQGLKEEFKLTEVTTDPAFLKVTMEGDESDEPTRRAYLLKFEVPPGQPITSKTLTSPGRVVLKTNHPAASEIVMEVLFVSQ